MLKINPIFNFILQPLRINKTQTEIHSSSGHSYPSLLLSVSPSLSIMFNIYSTITQHTVVYNIYVWSSLLYSCFLFDNQCFTHTTSTQTASPGRQLKSMFLLSEWVSVCVMRVFGLSGGVGVFWGPEVKYTIKHSMLSVCLLGRSQSRMLYQLCNNLKSDLLCRSSKYKWGTNSLKAGHVKTSEMFFDLYRCCPNWCTSMTLGTKCSCMLCHARSLEPFTVVFPGI